MPKPKMTVHELSQTYVDLYPKERNIALISFPQTSDYDLSSTLPRNRKFVFRGREDYGAGLPLRLKFLSLIPQRLAFAAGHMPVLCLDQDPSADKAEIEKNRDQIRRTFQVLDSSIRPDIHFFSKPADIPREMTLAMILPIDALAEHNHLVNMETHYELLSRECLAESGLDTTPTTFRFQPTRMPEECCIECNTPDAIAEKCAGKRQQWLKKQVDEITVLIKSHRLPFVVKFQQSYSGGGVFLVNNEEDRKELKDNMPGLLQGYLPKLTKHNEKLNPGLVLFTDMVQNIKENYALTFFVQADGRCLWTCVSQQHTDGETQYTGSSAVWSQQPQLRTRFDPLMKQIGAHLHAKGYIGPVGADILEDASGKLYVIDLNVRPTSSTVLGPLQAFFVNHGYDYTTLIDVVVSLSRDEFETIFAAHLDQGSMLIIAWFENEAVSYGSVALGSHSKDELDAMQKLFKPYQPSDQYLEDIDV